ncbi:MAG: type I-E CRISPR-associated protein Cse2/CasB [Janthinobacterium lividum]
MLHSENKQDIELIDLPGLIRWLHRQARDADQNSSSRTALAELRRGLRSDPRNQFVTGKYVVPFLGSEPRTPWQSWQEKCCYLVTALFASHPTPEHKHHISLGAALGQIQEKSGSIEGRFLQLLAVRPDRRDDPERLRVPLRQAVSLLAANSVQLDWQRLLTDLWQWNHDEKRVQQRWARDFYKAAPDRALDPALDLTETMNDDTIEGDTDEN